MMRRVRSDPAFTLLELIVIFTMVFILLVLVTAATINARAKQQRINCVKNFKMVGLAYRIWATDNSDLFPWQAATNAPSPKTFDDVVRHFQTISNELVLPKYLCCITDTRKPAADWASLSRTNISYFLSLDADETFPQSILAGDRNVTTNGARIGTGIVKIGDEANVAFDATMHRFQGNC